MMVSDIFLIDAQHWKKHIKQVTQAYQQTLVYISLNKNIEKLLGSYSLSKYILRVVKKMLTHRAIKSFTVQKSDANSALSCFSRFGHQKMYRIQVQKYSMSVQNYVSCLQTNTFIQLASRITLVKQQAQIVHI